MELRALESIDVTIAMPFEPPAREQSCADHDEPWQFQVYHLTMRERAGLIRRRDRAHYAEWHVS